VTVGPSTLLERLTPGALERAWQRIRRPRMSRPDLGRLLRDVRSGRYRPGRPWLREVPKRSGGVRRLCVPRTVDRVLQRAVLDVVPTPVHWVRSQVHGYVRGRSPRTALADLVRQVGGRPWLEIVQVDVADLFDDLQHDRLRRVLRRRWPDPLFESLCLAWARAYGSSGRGVGQGSPISPLLANLYLDHYLDPTTGMAADAGWIRYADDITAVTARPGGALVLYAAMELACHAAGLRVAMHKVTVCLAPDGGALRVLGERVRLVEGDGDWSLAIDWRPGGRRRRWRGA